MKTLPGYAKRLLVLAAVLSFEMLSAPNPLAADKPVAASNQLP